METPKQLFIKNLIGQALTVKTNKNMDEDVINPVPPTEGEEGDDKEVDPDMIEDTFDDVDPL